MARMRKPAETVAVPQNGEEANGFLLAIGDRQRALTVIQAALDESVAATKAQAEAAAKPLQAEIEAYTRGLQMWAEANRQVLTDGGKRQTVALPAGEIGWRRRPSSVRVGNMAEALAYLVERGLTAFVRTKHELNKEALLADPVAAGEVPGVRIGSAGEDFVVQPTGVAISPPAAA